MLNSEILVIAFHTILFQRQLYQRQLFHRRRKWGVPVMICEHDDVLGYINQVVSKLTHWFGESQNVHIALVVLDYQNVVVERWQFEFEYDPDARGDRVDEKKQRQSLQTLIRQLSATSTVLPILIGEHTFRIVVEEHPSSIDSAIPEGWQPVSQNMSCIGSQADLHWVETKERWTIRPSFIYKIAEW